MPDFTKIIAQNAQAVKFSHGCGGKNTQKSQKVRASRPCPGRRTVCSRNSPNPAAFRSSARRNTGSTAPPSAVLRGSALGAVGRRAQQPSEPGLKRRATVRRRQPIRRKARQDYIANTCRPARTPSGPERHAARGRSQTLNPAPAPASPQTLDPLTF